MVVCFSKLRTSFCCWALDFNSWRLWQSWLWTFYSVIYCSSDLLNKRKWPWWYLNCMMTCAIYRTGISDQIYDLIVLKQLSFTKSWDISFCLTSQTKKSKICCTSNPAVYIIYIRLIRMYIKLSKTKKGQTCFGSNSCKSVVRFYFSQIGFWKIKLEQVLEMPIQEPFISFKLQVWNKL